MHLEHETSSAAVGFRVVCDACGGLQIKPVDLGKPASIVHCGRCGAVRGTLADLNDLARGSKGVFEF